MRTLIVALGLAAVAANPAFAQSRASTSASGAGTTGGVATGTSTTTTTSTVPSISAEPVLTSPAPSASAGTSTTPSGGATTGFGTNVTNDANAATPGNAFAPGGAFGPATGNTVVGTPVPEGTVSVIGSGTTGAQVVGVPSTQSQQVIVAPATPTPLFDQAAREGRAKEAARRARGEEPRVYGIAPNTERDLTWQMPDDRIIRY
jgi:hypothetical protein